MTSIFVTHSYPLNSLSETIGIINESVCFQFITVFGCGGNHTANQGMIGFLHTFADHYEDSIDCFWRITVDCDRSVELTFEILEIEYEDVCRHSFVEVSI